MFKKILTQKFAFLLLISFICLSLFSFQNCANTSFGYIGAKSVSEEKSEPVVYDEEIPVDVTSVTELPKITTSIPDCQPNTICRIQFKMQKALTLDTKFKWKTDDDPNSQWKTDPLPSNVVWGVAGIHYVVANGEIVFKSGETEKVIEVQNINQTSSGIRLKVLLNFCHVGEVSYRCQLFF